MKAHTYTHTTRKNTLMHPISYEENEEKEAAINLFSAVMFLWPDRTDFY